MTPHSSLHTIFHQSLDIKFQNLYTFVVLTTPGYNDVGIFFCWLNKLLMHWFEHILIALYHHVYGTVALYTVALNVSYQSLIIIGVNVYLQVHHVAQFFVDKRHDTLDDNHGARLHVDCLGKPVTYYI